MAATELRRQQPDSAETDAAERDWLEHWRTGPMRQRWTELPPQRGDRAPDLELLEARSGEWLPLSRLWADGAAGAAEGALATSRTSRRTTPPADR